MLNTILQSKNLPFYFYKSKETQWKFRGKFPESLRNSKNSREKFLRKISRKFRVFFSVKYNATEQKSIFLFL